MKSESWWRRLRRKTSNGSRRGVILLLSTGFLVVMFGFASFAIDLGWIVLTMQQLQNAADAAALAAVLELKTSDPNLTVAQMRTNAVNQAVKAASLNKAGNRSVDLSDLSGGGTVGQTYIRFGNRHYDNTTDKWVTYYDGDSRLGQLPLNAVDVQIAFDQTSGVRRQLDLLFAPVIGRKQQVVAGDSRSHLTPRDLTFVLDISGSMGDDSDGASDVNKEYRKMIFPAWENLGLSNYNANAGASISATYDRNYSYLWTQLTNTGTGSSSKGIFGTNAATITQFAEQEFGDCPTVSGVRQYWKHWKWEAFCDCYARAANGTDSNSNGNDRRDDIYEGTIGYTNKNVLYSTNNTSSSSTNGVYSFNSYCRFVKENGLIPAIRGQRFYPRDKDLSGTTGNGAVDTFPPAGGNSDYLYPSTGYFYPKPQDLASFNKAYLYSGSTFTGVYADGNYQDTYLRPMCWVRRAALHGINAMISDEVPGQEAFDQVGVLTFGTLAHRDLELTNNIDLAFKITASRVTYANSSTNITPRGNGYTNIGMAIREGLREVKYSPRSRDWTNKTVALLTDGAPTVALTGDSFVANSAPPTPAFGGDNYQYGRDWADVCVSEGVILHTIGVGDGLNQTGADFLSELASKTGGVYFRVANLDQNNTQLNEIFIAIGKDKLGKLYTD